MKLVHTLTVRASVALFAGIAIVALLVVGGLGLLAMNHGETMAARVLADVKLTRAAGTADMMHDALRGDVLAARLAGAGAPADQQQAIRSARDEHEDAMQKAMATLAAHPATDEVGRALSGAGPAVQAYLASSRRAVDGALAGAADDAARQAFDAAFGELEKRLESLSGAIEASAGSTVALQNDTFRHDRWLLLGAAGLALLAMAAYGARFVRTTMDRLGAEPAQLRDFSAAIADGALDGRFATTPKPDSVAGSMLRMQEQLAHLVSDVRQNAEALASASAQIAQGSLELSTRTEEQAGALQQTAASMEQLGTSVVHNADSAQQASTLAAEAAAVAQRSGETIGQVVDTMKGIDDASRRIADIISVVDGIAFQTNILALNAAVEAARAGEQGRGFAVVAGEVRTLAKRAGDAAKEIRGLVATTQERVQAGGTLVDQAGRRMGEVLTTVARANELMAQLNVASAEQRNSVGQVVSAIGQIDQTTQQNAALVEESAAAADSLKQQAERLVQAVAVFRVDGGSAGTETPAALARALVAKVAASARVTPATPAPRSAAVADRWESF